MMHDYVTPFALSVYFLLLTALAATIVGGVLAGPTLDLLVRLKSRQTISKFVPEHAAKQGTPTMGGLIVGAGFLAGIAFVFIQLRDEPSTPARRFYGAIALLFLAFALIGFVDDYVVPRTMKGKRGLGWIQKLALEAVAALLFVFALGRSMSTGQAAAGVFLVLFFSNAYNFSDGLDALAGGLLLALVFGLAMVADARLETGVYPVLGALLGGILPFLWLNVPPARVFMGDVGSLPIGATLGAVVATLAIPNWSIALVSADSASFFPVAGVGLREMLPIFGALVLISGVMFVELVPVALQILSVKLFKRRIFPMTPIHHAFQKAGWPEKRIVAMFVGAQLVLSLLGGALAQIAKKPLVSPPSIELKPGKIR